MMVTAVFHGIMSDWLGCEKADFNLRAGAALADLVEEIFKAYRDTSPEQLWDHENKAFARPVFAFTGESSISDPDTILVDGQEVTFRLMLAGG